MLGGTADGPQFSSTWKVTTGTFTSGNTLNKLRFYANDLPDSLASGTYYTYYDFCLVCKGTFTFPFVSGNVALNAPTRDVEIPIPGRIGGVTQRLGSPLATLTISGDMDTGTGWNDDDTVKGGRFLDTVHNTDEPWQWVTSDLANMKVTTSLPKLSQEADSKVQRRYELKLKEYRLSDAVNESYLERFGLV